MEFLTSDINLTAYLVQKGHKVKRTQPNGRFTEFIFELDDKAGEQWQFDPTPEMQLVQGFIAEKDKLLNFLKTKQRSFYGNNQAL